MGLEGGAEWMQKVGWVVTHDLTCEYCWRSLYQ